MSTTTPRTRRIALESCQNFRDIGGYETTDGRRVRWRTVYRSDTLHRLTDGDIETLRALDIDTVIDLRSSGEIERTGRVTHVLGTRYHHHPMIDEVVSSDRRPPVEERPAPGESYIGMLCGGGPAVAGALRALLEAQGRPAVIHCTAGKDRTGILAGLVLSALGVSDDDVVADYVLTNECRQERDAYLEVHDPEYLSMLRTLPPWVREAQPAAMQATLAHVIGTFGSVPTYLESLGLSSSDLDALRNALLEP